MKEEKVTFQNSRTQKLVGILTRPEGNNLPLVIIGHGLTSGKSSKSVTAISRALLKNSIASLRFDISAHGESEGNIEEITISKAVEDLKSAFNFVRNLDWVDKHRIGLLGSSFTGVVSVIFVAKYNNIKILALKCPALDYTEIRLDQLGEEGVRKWKEEGIFDFKSLGIGLKYSFYEDCKSNIAYNFANKIKIPTLLVHGSKDKTVPIKQSEKLFEMLNCERKLKVIKGADHTFTNPQDFKEMVKTISDWFNKWLK
ncbi:MAG: alpha/beta hydrolase [Candidatus Woesearchaeota archaeon]|nr:MAG: alpha/beta hydrolase [Candidatus Woesearchaeota archaeon]